MPPIVNDTPPKRANPTASAQLHAGRRGGAAILDQHAAPSARHQGHHRARPRPQRRARAPARRPATHRRTVEPPSTVVVDDTVDTEDPTAAPENEPNAAANVKSTAETGRIDGFAGANGYDGIWHPADKSDGADAAGADLADDDGDGSSDNAGDDPAARPAAEAAGARPTDTEPSTGADTEPAKH